MNPSSCDAGVSGREAVCGFQSDLLGDFFPAPNFVEDLPTLTLRFDLTAMDPQVSPA